MADDNSVTAARKRRRKMSITRAVARAPSIVAVPVRSQLAPREKSRPAAKPGNGKTPRCQPYAAAATITAMAPQAAKPARRPQYRVTINTERMIRTVFPGESPT